MEHTPKKPAFSEMDVIGRCKQCGSPVTEQIKVSSVMGMFCSELCKEKFETFAQRAAELDARRPPRTKLRFRIKAWINRLIFLVLLLALIGGVSWYFQIPVLAPIVARLLRMVGL